MQIFGRRYDTGQPVTVITNEEKIERVDVVTLASTHIRDGRRIPWLAPGLIDLQVNGFGGQDFTDLNLETRHVEQIGLALDQMGVVNYCPTVTTHCHEVIVHALNTLSLACDSIPDVAQRVYCIHLEGPYLSSEDGPRGAHPEAHCREPNWDEFQKFQDAAQGRIGILTMSPEYSSSTDFISKVTNSGVIVAIGHANADSKQIKAAVDAGARFSTHLGNGAHRQLPRHPNYIWDQLAEDRLWASLILDSHHLPPEVVKTFIRAKTPERCILVSDITGMAGMNPGRYQSTSLGNIDVLPDGRLVIAGQNQLLAGASLPLTVGVANAMRLAGVNLQTAIEMASLRPLELLGDSIAPFSTGSTANLIQFDLPGADGQEEVGEMTIVATINEGQVVFGSNEETF